jgi:hypothetical protein
MRYNTVGVSVRRRSVALVTRDPSLYHELAGFLRERDLPSLSLLPGERIPEQVAVILTSEEERPLIVHPRVLAVREGGDPHAMAAAIAHALAHAPPTGELVVGLDPGPRPGYAVLCGSMGLGEGNLESPEAVVRFAAQLRQRFPTHALRFRVGSGDPPARNRIVNGLLLRNRWVELVDERGTTPRGRRRPRDALAARTIARTPGVLLREALPAHVTPGEIANLQRLSREGSGGRVTISRSSAHRVLRGEITLAEAVGLAASERFPAGEPRSMNRQRL